MTVGKLTVLLTLITAPAVAQSPARGSNPPSRPPAATQPGSGGKVMYFHKPADTVLPAGGTQVVEKPSPSAVTIPDVPPIPISQPTPTRNSKPQPVPTFVAQEQPPKDKQPPISQDYLKRAIQLPARERVFVIQDDVELEQAIMNRLRQDAKEAGLKLDDKMLKFPPLPDVASGQVYKPKTGTYPPMQVTYVPTYIIHRRLHFEELNSERYGWDLGIIQPFVSTLYFYKDFLLWPNSLASGCVYGFWDTNAGKCWPGSPTPYFLYPPGLTITGSAFEGVIITGAAFAVP